MTDNCTHSHCCKIASLILSSRILHSYGAIKDLTIPGPWKGVRYFDFVLVRDKVIVTPTSEKGFDWVGSRDPPSCYIKDGSVVIQKG